MIVTKLYTKGQTFSKQVSRSQKNGVIKFDIRISIKNIHQWKFLSKKFRNFRLIRKHLFNTQFWTILVFPSGGLFNQTPVKSFKTTDHPKKRRQDVTCDDSMECINGDCVDIDECASANICQPFENCVNSAPGYSCEFDYWAHCPSPHYQVDWKGVRYFIYLDF